MNKRIFIIFSMLALASLFISRAYADTDIVVLGGLLNDDLTMNNWTEARVSHAGKIFSPSKIRQIIVSGKGTRTKTEASAMKEYLINSGISQDYIKQEEESMTTLENALFVYNFLEKTKFPEKLILITNDFHMDRSMLLFRLVFGKTGTEIIASGAPNTGISNDDLAQKTKLEENYVTCFNKIVLPTIPAGDVQAITSFSKGKGKIVIEFRKCRQDLQRQQLGAK